MWPRKSKSLRLPIPPHLTHTPPPAPQSGTPSQPPSSGESSDSEVPDAAAAIYHPDMQNNSAYNPKGGGHNEKYFFAIDTIPGQPRKFLLPPGADACPVVSCPRYNKQCRPHWRLNEHMKTRHGWPRKNTQPYTDKRLGTVSKHTNRVAKKSMRKRSTSRSSKSGSGGDSNIIDPAIESSELSELESDDEISDRDPQVEQSRPKRAIKLTEKRKSQLHNDVKRRASHSESEASSQPKADSSGRNHRTRISTGATIAKKHVDTYDSDTLIDHEQPTPAFAAQASNSAPTTIISDDADIQMVTMMKDLTESLRGAKGTGRSDSVKLAQKYDKLIKDEKFKVNTKITETDQELLSSLYKTVAERHNAQQQIMQMPLETVQLPASENLMLPPKSPASSNKRSSTAQYTLHFPSAVSEEPPVKKQKTQEVPTASTSSARYPLPASSGIEEQPTRASTRKRKPTSRASSASIERNSAQVSASIELQPTEISTSTHEQPTRSSTRIRKPSSRVSSSSIETPTYTDAQLERRNSRLLTNQTPHRNLVAMERPASLIEANRLRAAQTPVTEQPSPVPSLFSMEGATGEGSMEKPKVKLTLLMGPKK